MSDKQPVVSVVMPVYNSAAFLEQAVLSVLNQTYQNWELVLVDDASTDESFRIASCLASQDPRIRLMCNEENLGVSQTRNRGIRAARGAWIALLDSDDYWTPDKLEKQMSLVAESNAEILYCSYALVRENGEAFSKPFLVPASTSPEEMLVRSVISCSTAVIRRDCLLAHPFGNDFIHEDLVLWLELLRAGCRACGCGDVLAYYRVSDHSRSGNKAKSAVGRWRVFREYLHLPFLRSLSLFAQYAIAAVRKYEGT